MRFGLPIDDALPDLLAALRSGGRAVLQAPPGAGKTTTVPLAMLAAGLTEGRILMLEPRRLAARAAAERMADTLGDAVGATVGYRVRGEAKVSRATRIEVVTEGILTRMVQSDPELTGIGAVIFDEVHERSLNADLGLALCLEIAEALRPDLLLVAMSATLDAEPFARIMDAPLISAEGRMFPVDIHWLDRPLQRGARFEPALADLVAAAAAETGGGMLVFLPGEGEIRRTEALLKDRLPADHRLLPLFGAMDFAAQRAALRPATEGRNVVLATAIAETSLTIPDTRVVIDGGRARRARFDPGSGMSRLVTEKVTRAEATQRAGRAGRVASGTCYRLWTRGEDGALAAFPPAEIEAADLAGLALELALWGAGPDSLPFLTPPPEAAFAEAVALLQMLGALDARGGVTPHGRTLAGLPLHPRLAHMLARGGPAAALTAALLADRDILGRGAPVDLTLRVEAARDPRRFERERGIAPRRGALERVKTEARRLAASRRTPTSVSATAGGRGSGAAGSGAAGSGANGSDTGRSASSRAEGSGPNGKDAIGARGRATGSGSTARGERDRTEAGGGRPPSGSPGGGSGDGRGRIGKGGPNDGLNDGPNDESIGSSSATSDRGSGDGPNGAPTGGLTGGPRADLTRTDLSRTDLSRADLSLAELAALAYPDRIGLRRPGDAPRYVLSGGKGAALPEGDPLSGQRLIVATDLDGDPREARVRQAVAIAESEVRALFPDRIGWVEICEWSRRDRRVLTRRREMLGMIALDDRTWPDAPAEAVARAMLDGVRDLGLPTQEAARLFRARVDLARAAGHDLPDMSDDALLADPETWLLPHLTGVRTAAEWKRFDLLPALRGMLDWAGTQTLDTVAPRTFTTPLGRQVPIDYSDEVPGIAVRLQELFGQTVHPTVAGRPLRIALLSPAGRPQQVTMDLPGFWASSYAEVRKDMRGRYPRHPWPEDPTQADPTLRAKPRG